MGLFLQVLDRNSLSKEFLMRQFRGIAIISLRKFLNDSRIDPLITIDLSSSSWLNLDQLHQTCIRFDRISKEIFLTYRLFQMYTIITYSSLQSQLPQIWYSIGDYIHMDKHFFTIFIISETMISWSYLMLQTIRKLKLYTPTILQIDYPRNRSITLPSLRRHSISSSHIELWSLEEITTLGIGEFFYFKPLCHCLHWSHQHQHEDHDDPW